jgi:hypothetical protein
MSIEELEKELAELDSRSRGLVMRFLMMKNLFSKLGRLEVPGVKSFLSAVLQKSDLRYKAST